MGKLRGILASLMFFALCGGCVGVPRQPAESYNPFKIDIRQFYRDVRTIAIAPLRLPEGVLEADAVKAQLETVIEERLQEAGFKVIWSAVYRETEEKRAREIGGYFDVKTGEIDEEKFRRVQKQTREDLHIIQQAEAFLYGAVRVIHVRFFGGTVWWHGMQEKISKTGKRSESDMRGTTSALSLWVRVEDPEGTGLYVNWGGIQLLSKLEDKGKVFSNTKFVSISEEEILSDRERNKNAVDIALSPLLKKPAPAELPEPSKLPGKKEP